MKTTLLFVLSAASIAAAYGSNAVDPAVKWTIYSGYYSTGVLDSTNTAYIIQPCTPGTPGCTSSAVFGDGLGDYISGQDHVNCTIHVLVGTYDATLGFATNSSRWVGFNLGAQLAYNPTTTQPSADITGHGFLNVNYILYPTAALGSTMEDDFTTRFVSSPPGAGDLRMSSGPPSSPDTPPSLYWGTFDNNYPFETALVHVHHCPDTTAYTTTTDPYSAWCPASHKESWYVYPDPGPQGLGPTPTWATTWPMTILSTNTTQVAMLVSVVTTKTTTTVTPVGQYSLPFYFKIELK